MISKDRSNQQKACPGLGFAYDQSNHSLISNPLHNCYYQPIPDVITLVHQETYCLSENFIHCPIYLKKIQSIPFEATTNTKENLKPERRAFKLTLAQMIYLITILLLFLLIILLLFLKNSPLSPREPVLSSSDNPMAVITFIITPTEITPNATWYAELTQQALLLSTPTLLSDLFPTRSSIANLNPTAIICDQPDGWIVYTVDEGDTLQSLGRLTYITVMDLMVANCMTINSLTVDQQIFLPYYPGSATSTSTAYPTSTRTRTATPTTALGSTSIPVLPSNTSPPPATATNTIVPTVTNTKNPLFRDTPTPSNTPLPIATDTPSTVTP